MLLDPGHEVRILQAPGVTSRHRGPHPTSTVVLLRPARNSPEQATPLARGLSTPSLPLPRWTGGQLARQVVWPPICTTRCSRTPVEVALHDRIQPCLRMTSCMLPSRPLGRL